jgi:putative peptide zinc metalloprotease protein
MLERLTALMASRHGPKIFVASLIVVLGSTTGVVVRAATDGGNGDNNVAVAVNTKDDSEVFKLKFKVTKTKGEVSDPTNAAVAYSSCENCRTIAIAIEAVIVLNDPSIISPTNLALAINENCSLCETYADARQHVITSDTSKFSPEGRARINDIRAGLRELRKLEREGDLTFDELKARVDALSAELADVLADEFRASSDAAPDISPSASPSGDPSETGTTNTTPTETSPTSTESTATPSESPVESSPAPSPGLSR